MENLFHLRVIGLLLGPLAAFLALLFSFLQGEDALTALQRTLIVLIIFSILGGLMGQLDGSKSESSGENSKKEKQSRKPEQEKEDGKAKEDEFQPARWKRVEPEKEEQKEGQEHEE